MIHRAAACLTGAVLLAGCPAEAPPRTIALIVIETANSCTLRWDGRSVDDPAAAQRLLALQREGAELVVTNAQGLSPRCAGGTIYSMERAGSAKIGYVAPAIKDAR